MLSKSLNDGFHEMKLQHVQECANLFARAFAKDNIIWSSYNNTLEELEAFFIQEVSENLESQHKVSQELGRHIALNFIYTLNGKIIAAVLNQELHLHWERMEDKKKKKTIKLKMFQMLQVAGQRLVEGINFTKDQFQRGKVVYANFGAIDSLLGSSRLSHEITLLTFKRFEQQGFEDFYFRASNIKMYKLFESIGGKLLNQVTVEDGDKKYEMYFATVKMHNPTFVKKYAMLEKLKNKSTISAKL